MASLAKIDRKMAKLNYVKLSGWFLKTRRPPLAPTFQGEVVYKLQQFLLVRFSSVPLFSHQPLAVSITKKISVIYFSVTHFFNSLLVIKKKKIHKQKRFAIANVRCHFFPSIRSKKEKMAALYFKNGFHYSCRLKWRMTLKKHYQATTINIKYN